MSFRRFIFPSATTSTTRPRPRRISRPDKKSSYHMRRVNKRASCLPSGLRPRSLAPLSTSYRVITAFARDQRGPWQWLAATRGRGGAGAPASASRRRRRMRAQFARCIRRSRSRAPGAITLTLSARPGGEQGPSTPRRLKVYGAAAAGREEGT